MDNLRESTKHEGLLGFEIQCGIKGSKLAGGRKQRVAIARPWKEGEALEKARNIKTTADTPGEQQGQHKTAAKSLRDPQVQVEDACVEEEARCPQEKS